MDSTDNKDDIDKVSADVCANCGKGEEASINLKSCAACRLVKYCSRACQVAHRPQHKKACKKHATELHDVLLFKQPPPLEDCPICFLLLPSSHTGSRYMNCCGKIICSGCAYAPVYDNQGNIVVEKTCPFCRTPKYTSEEELGKRIKTRIEAGDVEAMFNMGCDYYTGANGSSQDCTKALELWHRAGKLGHAESYYNIGAAYVCDDGGVEMDVKKANRYYELAAMGGNVIARYNLGAEEANAGNFDSAMNHWMISVKSGSSDSLKGIQELFKNGLATKDDYANALRVYQGYLNSIKSDQRDEAASFSDSFKYIDSVLPNWD